MLRPALPRGNNRARCLATQRRQQLLSTLCRLGPRESADNLLESVPCALAQLRRAVAFTLPVFLVGVRHQLAGQLQLPGGNLVRFLRRPGQLRGRRRRLGTQLGSAAVLGLRRLFRHCSGQGVPLGLLLRCRQEGVLLLPEGRYGPGFLTLRNYYVLKDYNFSDLYVLFVGHLSDRITDPRPFETPWSKTAQLRSGQVEQMQRRLTDLGIYRDKIDGKAGMLTRAALGAYQKGNGLKVDCWPTPAVLEHMQRASSLRVGGERR